ncbi:hypothetical protein [Marivivens niveibacter]|uniref:hypothetical protein n=1 Tax=Marivivens niveibacter TaxID=1930667 RepID=UPI0010557CCC|nr:hypothetical protein [Marivivens niveibacter]
MLIMITFSAGIYLFNRNRAEASPQSKNTNWETSIGQIEIGDDGGLYLPILNATNDDLDITVNRYLRYRLADESGSSGVLLAKSIRTHVKTHDFTRVTVADDTKVTLERDEHLYHPQILPIIEKSGNLLTLLKNEPDLYSIECRVWTLGHATTRSFRFGSD